MRLRRSWAASVVRDTRAQLSTRTLGLGIHAGIDPRGQGRGSTLTLRDSLVAANRVVGIQLSSSTATLERSVVRDTRQQLSEGRGLKAAPLPQPPPTPAP